MASRTTFHTSGSLETPEYIQSAKIADWLSHWNPTFAGSLSNLTVNIESNFRIADATITIWKNGAATDLTLTVPALASGVITGTGSISFEPGDKIIGLIEYDAANVAGPYDEWESVGYTIADIVTRNEITYICVVTHETPQDPEDYDTGGWEFWSELEYSGCNFVSLSLVVETEDALGYYPIDNSVNLGTGGDSPNDWPLPSGPFGWQVNVAVDYEQAGPEKVATSDSSYESCWPLSFIPGGVYAYNFYWNGVDAAERRRAQETSFRTSGTLKDFRIFREEAYVPGAEGYPSVEPVKLGIKKNGEWALSIEPVEDLEWTECDWLTSETEIDIVSGDRCAISHDLASEDIPPGVVTDDWVMASGHYCLPKMLYVSDDEWFDIHAHGYTPFGQSYSAYYADEDDMPLYTGGVSYFNLFSSIQHEASITGDRGFWEYGTAEEMEFRNLRVNVGYFNGTPVTLGLMIDGVPANQFVTIDGTGWFEDTVNTDVAAQIENSTALICYYLDPGEGGAFMRIDSIEITARLTDQTPVVTCEQECPNAYTIEQMRERTLKMLGEDPAAPVYWTANEIDRYINDAYIKAARESKAIEYIEGIELAADNEAGTLSDYVGQILRVTYDDRKIHNLTKFELDRLEFDWENQSGYVDSYVTTLNDNRGISTFKAWDGGADNSYGPFYSDGAHTYAAWVTATAYVDGDRVTVEDANGITRGYVCTSNHTSGASTEPGTGASWETVWVPIVLMVWAVKNPAIISGECAEPELPPYSHLGLCYAAAAAALLKHGEMRDEAMAAFYASIAQEYLSLLKGYTNNRTPERVLAVGGQTVGIRRPKPWDRVIE